MSHNHIGVGRRVLDIEARAVDALKDSLDDSFSAACDLMLGARGRVIVTGMGKSGHVGSKLAATLASTGTPAFFVHPGEASHGDLGMITTDDVVLAQVGFRPEWSQVLPFGGNLAAPTSFAYGIYGNGATLGGGNEGVYNWSVGLEATFRARYVVSLKYNDQHADYTAVNGVVSTASGGAVQNNHGWVSLAFQTTF